MEHNEPKPELPPYEQLASLSDTAKCRLELDALWREECNRASDAGEFPERVKLCLFKQPPPRQAERWSNDKFKVELKLIYGFQMMLYGIRPPNELDLCCWVFTIKRRAKQPEEETPSD